MTDDPRARLPVPNRRPEGGRRASPQRPRNVVEPSLVYEPPPPPRGRGDPAMRKDLGLVLFTVAALAIGVAAWSLAGRFTSEAFTAPASSSLVARATPPLTGGTPSAEASSAAPTSAPSPSASSDPSPTPPPQREPVDVRIESRPAAVFVSEQRDTWCAAAAVQIALNVNGPADGVDTTRAQQARIRELQVQLTTRRDSRNGGAGPEGMVRSLERLGRVDYRLRVYRTRGEALRAAAKAIGETRHAAILLAWRGAHAWVMTGYRADADPTLFDDARIRGAYILDPWYPRVSSIWGRSDKPGVYQDGAEMRRNFLPWRRPEGRYPARDGRFLVILPTS